MRFFSEYRKNMMTHQSTTEKSQTVDPETIDEAKFASDVVRFAQRILCWLENGRSFFSQKFEIQYRIGRVCLVIFLLLCSHQVSAKKLFNGEVCINGLNYSHNEQTMSVEMNIDIHALKVKTNQKIQLIPVLHNGNTTKELPAILLMGRRRYIYYQRNRTEIDPQKTFVVYEANGNQPGKVPYAVATPYEEWMNQTIIELKVVTSGCCGHAEHSVTERISHTRIRDFVPALAYIIPAAETRKERSQAVSANVVFEFNHTVLKQDYHNNRNELQKIEDAIDHAKDDHDVAISKIQLIGYASPDGAYSNNERLARNRTEVIGNFIEKNSGFSSDKFQTSSVAEDWNGLKELISESNLNCKEEALKIINLKYRDPDEKEKDLKAVCGAEFRLVLNNLYPKLRHTDCMIEYTVRNFSVAETKQILKEQPQKLSLLEFYNYACQFQVGSNDFCDALETAVKMFPTNETANLNAANVALSKHDLPLAEKFLAQAGQSAEAQNARGVLAEMKGKHDAALKLFQTAAEAGLQAAKDNLLKHQ